MARKPYDTFSDQRKAGGKRRRDGITLMRCSRLRGGMYLLGYAVECGLKSYIMSRLDAQHLEDAEGALRERFCQEVSLTSGHDLRRLYEVAEDLGLDIGTDGELWKARNQAFRWQPHWRYEHREPRRDDAEHFAQKVSEFYNWSTEQI